MVRLKVTADWKYSPHIAFVLFCFTLEYSLPYLQVVLAMVRTLRTGV